VKIKVKKFLSEKTLFRNKLNDNFLQLFEQEPGVKKEFCIYLQELFANIDKKEERHKEQTVQLPMNRAVINV